MDIGCPACAGQWQVITASAPAAGAPPVYAFLRARDTRTPLRSTGWRIAHRWRDLSAEGQRQEGLSAPFSIRSLGFIIGSEGSGRVPLGGAYEK